MIRIRLPSSGSARLGVFSTGQCHETPMPMAGRRNSKLHHTHPPFLPGRPSRQARHLRFAPSASAAPPMASHRFHRDWRRGMATRRQLFESIFGACSGSCCRREETRCAVGESGFWEKLPVKLPSCTLKKEALFIQPRPFLAEWEIVAVPSIVADNA